MSESWTFYGHTRWVILTCSNRLDQRHRLLNICELKGPTVRQLFRWYLLKSASLFLSGSSGSSARNTYFSSSNLLFLKKKKKKKDTSNKSINNKSSPFLIIQSLQEYFDFTKTVFRFQSVQALKMPIKLFKRNANFLVAGNAAVGINWAIRKHQKGRQNMNSCILFDVCLTLIWSADSWGIFLFGIFPILFGLGHNYFN